MNSLFIIVVLLTVGCNSQITPTEKSADGNVVEKTAISEKKGSPGRYATNDTLLIATEIGDTLKFSKEEFNRIVDEHPEFHAEFAYSPDYLYHHYGNGVDFGSEQGKDAYYALYAYFLKQKNGAERFAEQRMRLIEIFSNLNSLFCHFQYGGTYFGHQRLRILGYAEYSVYLYPKNGENFEKTYNIAKQKELHIKSLRQLSADEISVDNETLRNEKVERTKKLNRIVDDLDRLITNIFYLRRAQAFQYDNYEYY